MLTAKQIVDRGIITGPILDTNIQQVGIDVNLVEIRKIIGKGHIPVSGKTILAERGPIIQAVRKGDDQEAIWDLEAGSYEVTFRQGCNIPSDNTLKIVQRSSVLRNAGLIISSIFDPGFKTEQMGCVMNLLMPMIISEGARVAQAYVLEHDDVDSADLYNGQFQNDSQRETL